MKLQIRKWARCGVVDLVKASVLDAEGVGFISPEKPKNVQYFSATLSQVCHPTRVIRGRFNREMITDRKLCQVSHLSAKRGPKLGMNNPIILKYSGVE